MESRKMLQQVMKNQNHQGPLVLTSFDSLMNYENESLLIKFRKNWSVTEEEAKDIFRETKKFLYLCAYGQTNCINIEVHSSLQIIDEMWHSFILFTDDYHSFCENNFGAYLHHFPFTRNSLKEKIKYISLKNSSFQKEKTAVFRSQIELIEKLFGSETVVKWYLDYADIYSFDCLNSLRKPLEGTGIKLEKVDRDAPLSILVETVKAIGLADPSPSCGCSGKGCGAGCSCNSR